MKWHPCDFAILFSYLSTSFPLTIDLDLIIYIFCYSKKQKKITFLWLSIFFSFIFIFIIIKYNQELVKYQKGYQSNIYQNAREIFWKC
jgi:hypothetical protein